MRRIAGMDDIPRDDEFHFKDRATKLVTTWQAIIQKAESEAALGQTNGVAASSKDDVGVSDTTQEKEKVGAKPAAVNGKKSSSQDSEMVNGDTKDPSQMDITRDAVSKTDGAAEEKKDDEEAMDMSDS